MTSRYLDAARSQHDMNGGGYEQGGNGGMSQNMASNAPTASSSGASSSMVYSSSSDGAGQAYYSHEGSDAVGQSNRIGLSIQQTRKPDCLRKLVVVGDGGCGKTCLLIVYSENRFPEAYIPTVFENYQTMVTYENKVIELALWDTAGQEDYDRLRPLSYPESNVLLIIFAVDYPTSLMNVEDKWHPEVSHFCPSVPLVLVATKTDLRRDQRTVDLLAAQGTHPVSADQGTAVAKRIGAKYAECSAKTGQGVKEVFNMALKESMRGRMMEKLRKKTTCKLM